MMCDVQVVWMALTVKRRTFMKSIQVIRQG